VYFKTLKKLTNNDLDRKKIFFFFSFRYNVCLEKGSDQLFVHKRKR